jgi:hypothetical protein
MSRRSPLRGLDHHLRVPVSLFDFSFSLLCLVNLPRTASTFAYKRLTIIAESHLSNRLAPSQISAIDYCSVRKSDFVARGRAYQSAIASGSPSSPSPSLISTSPRANTPSLTQRSLNLHRSGPSQATRHPAAGPGRAFRHRPLVRVGALHVHRDIDRGSVAAGVLRPTVIFRCPRCCG